MRSRVMLVAAAIAATVAVAHASDDGDEHFDQQVVVVNAASRLGNVGQIQRLRRVLGSRNLLVRLPEGLEATLDGRNALLADVDAIKDAYSRADYETALRIIEADEARILGDAVSRDPIPALAELSQWRGIIAAALNQQDEAEGWFRAALRFNPAWTIDKRLASPRVRSLVRRAKREVTDTGALRVSADPDDARITIDGGEPRAASEKITLPTGKHLVSITADGRRPYAELIEIEKDKTFTIEISLDEETTLDRAARLVDATAAAPAGKPRLRRARALAKLTGVPRLLVIEDSGEDHVLVRLYDVETKKVSEPVELEGTASSAVIARRIVAALDPENLVDVNAIVVTQRTEQPRATPWYGRWYVWAAAGAVLVGGYASYAYVSREPTVVRGF